MEAKRWNMRNAHSSIVLRKQRTSFNRFGYFTDTATQRHAEATPVTNTAGGYRLERRGVFAAVGLSLVIPRVRSICRGRERDFRLAKEAELEEPEHPIVAERRWVKELDRIVEKGAPSGSPFLFRFLSVLLVVVVRGFSLEGTEGWLSNQQATIGNGRRKAGRRNGRRMEDGMERRRKGGELGHSRTRLKASKEGPRKVGIWNNSIKGRQQGLFLGKRMMVHTPHTAGLALTERDESLFFSSSLVPRRNFYRFTVFHPFFFFFRMEYSYGEPVSPLCKKKKKKLSTVASAILHMAVRLHNFELGVTLYLYVGLPSGPRSSRHFALIPSSIDSIGLAGKMKQTRPVTVIVIVVPAILFTCLAPWPFPPFHPINIQSLDALVAHPQLTPSSVPSLHLLSTDVGRWRWRRPRRCLYNTCQWRNLIHLQGSVYTINKICSNKSYSKDTYFFEILATLKLHTCTGRQSHSHLQSTVPIQALALSRSQLIFGLWRLPFPIDPLLYRPSLRLTVRFDSHLASSRSNSLSLRLSSWLRKNLQSSYRAKVRLGIREKKGASAANTVAAAATSRRATRGSHLLAVFTGKRIRVLSEFHESSSVD
ncbi:hypothetical protein CCUS01_15996 [Colletotrichum cuscutae]|uniref:Uncharacterized protein n=1 Tax=Colletotrichum cuscutae TaxID=1209917 RepID=A0AAI9Y7K1_9PEZI|nr:hypothetical protein CCUS01_15996 [Colletotrichum cuscutae]